MFYAVLTLISRVSFKAKTSFYVFKGYPRHRENRENAKKKIPVRGNTWNLELLSKLRENTGNFFKTQGILLAQVVNALILKVKDIAIFAAKKNPFFFPEAG